MTSPLAPGPRGALITFLGWFLFWNALGLFFSSQLYLEGAPIRIALAYSLPRWYAWGLLSPLVAWTDRRVGLVTSMSARVFWHVPLGIAWTLFSISIRLITRPLRQAAQPSSLYAYFLDRFYWDLLIYAVIAGVAIARDYAAQIQERDRQAHRRGMEREALERSLVEARLQSLRTQLHPHFLFNTLNTVSYFTETDPATARRLIEQLGDLLRASLTHTSNSVVSLSDELALLDSYLAIERARFEGRITVTVTAEATMTAAMVPGFLLQPLAENAIRHGLAARLPGGRLEVTALRDGERLRLTVRDDGIGLPPGWRFEDDAGVGLRNVGARLQHLYGTDHEFSMTGRPGGGVEVCIRIPFTPPSEAAL